ncbi:MAG: CPBP family intramembrane glutamic endopeptidase [Candidatus Thorarchaeota archaeon]
MDKENSELSMEKGSEADFSPMVKGFLMILFIGCSFLVFNVGGYNNFIPNNLTLLTRFVIVCILSLCTFILYKKDSTQNGFWRLSFSFLIASIGLLCAWIFGRWYELIPGLSLTTIEGVALAKFAEVLPIVIPIIIGIWLVERDFTMIFLSGGNLKRSVILGLVLSPVALIPFFALGGLGLSASIGLIIGWIPWMLVFAFSNAFMEELMIRGLFLKKYNSLFGQTQSLVLTSVIFAIFHQAILSYTDIIMFSAFLGITFVLGLVWGYIMQNSRNIWGAVIAHAVADILLLLTVFGV